MVMQRYANWGGDSNIYAYECGLDYILVQFGNGSVYKYSYSSAGSYHVETMKELAMSGSGLNSYIMRNVRNNYER